MCSTLSIWTICRVSLLNYVILCVVLELCDVCCTLCPLKLWYIICFMNYVWLFDLCDCKIVYKTVFRARARCILPRPAEDDFFRPRTRCILPRPAGENTAQRALAVYSAQNQRFSAPRYSAPVGDALIGFNWAGRPWPPTGWRTSDSIQSGNRVVPKFPVFKCGIAQSPYKPKVVTRLQLLLKHPV
jgi:hypothetical protein